MYYIHFSEIFVVIVDLLDNFCTHIFSCPDQLLRTLDMLKILLLSIAT
jgi:hypothetical protein